MAKTKTFMWDMPLREALETMLKDGFPISRISKELGITKPTIYAEVKRGVTDEEYKNHQYSKYTARKSVNQQMAAFRSSLIEGRSKEE